MKRQLFPGLVILGLLLASAVIQAQNEKQKQELVLRSEIEATKGNSAKLKEYVKLMGIDDERTVTQFQKWMKQFPDSPSFPMALGEAYYNHELPEATPYLKKVARLSPKNPAVWTMLAIDAERWGDEDLSLEYQRKGVEADPTNAQRFYQYAYSFKKKDRVKWAEMLRSVPKKFPGDPSGASALSMLGYSQESNQDKIAVYEEMARLYKASDNIYAAVAISRLAQAYIEEGQIDKAIDLI